MQKILISIFGKHIANMYQESDNVYLEQIDDWCHKASPLMINANQKEIDTTSLVYLERVAGFVSDSLPGNFGNEILKDFFLKKSNKYPTVSDKLLFIGNRGVGAVTYEPSMEKENELIDTIELKHIFEEAKKIKRGGEYKLLQDAFLISAHSFVGGARSKAIGAINLDSKEIFLGDRTKPLKDGFMHAIIKYDDTSNNDENKSTYSKIEYIYHVLAIKSGINMMDCHLVETNKKHHFITKRFDIEPSGTRYHVHSLAGLLHLDYNIPRSIGYEDLLRVAVRLGALDSLKQLFLQMLFNYMFVNQDDHSRNFSFMCHSDFKWKATPAYDLTFAKGERHTAEHQLSLYGKALSSINIDDITTLATEFSIDLEFAADSLVKMKNLRDIELPKLLKHYNVGQIKQRQILEHTKTRTLQGAL